MVGTPNTKYFTAEHAADRMTKLLTRRVHGTTARCVLPAYAGTADVACTFTQAAATVTNDTSSVLNERREACANVIST